MVGGLIQLVVAGAQDLLLTGSPDITHFKIVYRRHGNFSKNQLDIPIKRKVSFGNEYEVIIPKNGDLVNDILLSIDLPEARMQYKFTKEEEISKILTDNNIIIYNNTIFKSNIANLKSMLDLVDNTSVNIENNVLEPVMNRFFVQFAPGVAEGNYFIAVDIIRLSNGVSYINDESDNKFINKSNINEFLLNSKKFNEVYNGLVPTMTSTNNEFFSINGDRYETFIDLDFNLDLLNRILYETAAYDDIYLYLLLYSNKLIQDFQRTNKNLITYRDTILLLHDSLDNKIVLDSEVKILNRLRQSGDFDRKTLKTFDNNLFASDRLTVFIAKNFEDLFIAKDVNDIYFVYNKVFTASRTTFALNVVEVLLFKRGDHNQTADESTLRFDFIRNSVSTLKVGSFLANNTDSILGLTSEILETSEIVIDETTIFITRVFTVEKLFQIKVRGNIIDDWDFPTTTDDSTGRILYIYSTSTITEIPDGYLKLLVLGDSNYDPNTDVTTLIIGVNNSNINNVVDDLFITDEEPLLDDPDNFDIFRPSDFTSVAVGGINNVQFDSYETYRNLFNNATFNTSLIDEDFREIVFNSIESSMCNNIIIHRNIFNSFLENNLRIFQSFVYTPSNGIIDDSINKIDIRTADKKTFLDGLLFNETGNVVLKNTQFIQVPYIDFVNYQSDILFENVPRNFKVGLANHIDDFDDVIKRISYYGSNEPNITIIINFDLSDDMFWPNSNIIAVGDTLFIRSVPDDETFPSLTTFEVKSVVFDGGVVPDGKTTIIAKYLSGMYTSITAGNYIYKDDDNKIIGSIEDDFVTDNAVDLTTFCTTFDLATDFVAVDEKNYLTNFLLLDYVFEVYNYLLTQTPLSSYFSDFKNIIVVVYNIMYTLYTTDADITSTISTLFYESEFGSTSLSAIIASSSKIINMIQYAHNGKSYNKEAIIFEFIRVITDINDIKTILAGTHTLDDLNELTDAELQVLFRTFIVENIGYVYNNIADVFTNYVTEYYNVFNELFEANDIGATTSLGYQEIVENFNFDIKETQNDTNTIIHIADQSITNLTAIKTALNNKKTTSTSNMAFYNDNRNILNVLNIYLNEINFFSVDTNIIRDKVREIVVKTEMPLTFNDEFLHTDPNIFNDSMTEIYNEANRELTVDFNIAEVKSNFDEFYTNLLILRLIENSLEKNVCDFITESNIIRIIETAIIDEDIMDENFESEEKKIEFINTIIQNTENNIVKKYIPSYTNKYEYFKGIIVTNIERNVLEPTITIIRTESEQGELIRLLVDEARNGVRDDIFNLKLLTLFLLVSVADTTANGNVLVNTLIELVGTEYSDLFEQGINFTLYKTCLITEAEFNFISDNNGDLPNSLKFLDSAESVVSTSVVLRKTDIDGFRYDKDVDQLVRTKIYDAEYHNIVTTIQSIKADVLTGSIIALNTSVLSSLLDSLKIDIVKLIQTLNDKESGLINLLDQFDSRFAFINRQEMTNFDMLSFMQLIGDTVINEHYRKNNIRIDYTSETTNKFTSDELYTTQTLDVNKIIDTEQKLTSINDVATIIPNLKGLTNNISLYIKEFRDNNEGLESDFIQDQVNDVDSRTSIYSKFAWTNRIGLAIFDFIEYRIGDQVIERHFSDWINIWYELSYDTSHTKALAKMMGIVPELTAFDNKLKCKYRLYIPLVFTFCRHTGLAIPLIALPHTTMSVRFKLRDLNECVLLEKNTVFVDGLDRENEMRLKARLIAGFIYLDKHERNMFAKSKHEYLIEQLQYNNGLTVCEPEISAPIEFRNPCMDLFWVVQLHKFTNGSLENNERQWFNYSMNQVEYDNTRVGIETLTIDGKDYVSNIFSKGLNYRERNWFDYSNDLNPYDLDRKVNVSTMALDGKTYVNKIASAAQGFVQKESPIISTFIKSNNRDRTSKFDNTYHNIIQPYQSKMPIPSTGLNYYSFGLRPLEVGQPTGAFNLSFVEQNSLELEIDPRITVNNQAEVRIYGRTYNILRIMSGMAAVAFLPE
jgi:hypothetical protein